MTKSSSVWKEVIRHPVPYNHPEPYEHWYLRRKENGERTRSQADTPAKLLDKLFMPPNSFDKGNFDFLSSLGLFPLPGFTLGLPENLPDPTGLDVIVGVIETDIPLGHRAFRKKHDGSSRVLYHWDMRKGEIDGQPNQSLGTQYTQSEINALLTKHSEDQDLLKPLDEIAFNTEIGALDFTELSGHRGLAQRHAHGAHVLSMAAGSDPAIQDPANFSGKVGIVSVSMPPRWEFGEAGEFLDRYMLNAVVRLFLIVLKLREKISNPQALPAVINLAFGRQAGVKREDADILPILLKAIQSTRRSDSDNEAEIPAPFEIVMPTGNDNLGRVVAKYEIAAGHAIDVDWRLMPGDQSDNHMEVWAENVDDEQKEHPKLSVNLSPPTTRPATDTRRGSPAQYWDILNDGDYFGARIYRFMSAIPNIELDKKRPGYLFAVGPVQSRGDSLMSVPPGVWKVRLKNDSRHPIAVHLSVQTDQSVLPVANVSGRSYLDDKNYTVNDEQGRIKDAVHWTGKEWQSTEGVEGTRRHGTINAAASQRFSAVVGGYRASDGQPASYSATGLGEYGKETRASPSAVFQTDDSVVLGGVLAAGAADGSQVAMRGTSFASSKATRLVAQTWLAEIADSAPLRTASEIINRVAYDHEEKMRMDHETNPRFKAPYDGSKATHRPAIAKLGHGRAPDPVPPIISRK